MSIEGSCPINSRSEVQISFEGYIKIAWNCAALFTQGKFIYLFICLFIHIYIAAHLTEPDFYNKVA